MKTNIHFFILSFFCVQLSAQGFQINYHYSVFNKYANQWYKFPAVLNLDTLSGEKSYNVIFGIDKQVKAEQNTFSSKGNSQYVLFYTPKGGNIISERVYAVKEKDYVFEDRYSMTWKTSAETKLRDGLILNKAETDFRGRHYIAWYNSKIKVSVGPWKFINTPGLLYEIADRENLFKWELEQINNVKEKIENPFSNYKGEILSYHEFPELRYGLSLEKKRELERNPNDNALILERNGLEKTFEWEQ